MEVVVIEAVHESGALARISRIYDDEGFTAAFRVYKGQKIDETYQLEVVGENATMGDAVWQFNELVQVITGV